MTEMIDKFRHAFAGIIVCLKDPSVRLQFLLGAAAVAAGIILRLTLTEWIVFILCIGFVISTEIMNTCVERMCNLYTTDYDPRIKAIKDMAAASVLVSAGTSLLCAILILIRHLQEVI